MGRRSRSRSRERRRRYSKSPSPRHYTRSRSRSSSRERRYERRRHYDDYSRDRDRDWYRPKEERGRAPRSKWDRDDDSEEERPWSSDQISPCVMVRGIPAYTTEEMVSTLFSSFGKIRDVRLIREKETKELRGFCFVEFFDTKSSIDCMNYSLNDPIMVGDYELRISFADNVKGFKKPSGGAASAALEIAAGLGAVPQEALPENSQQMEESKMGRKWGAGDYYSHGEEPEMSAEEYERAKAAARHSVAASTAPNAVGMDAATLQAAGYVFDQGSGYYYNAHIGYYYDPKTTYFYDTQSGTYYLYNAATQQYYPAAQANEGQMGAEGDSQTKKKKEKKLGVSMSLQSAADVERWMRANNPQAAKKKAPAAPNPTPGLTSAPLPPSTAPPVNPAPAAVAPPATATVAATTAVGVSFACTICNRGFKTADQLAKHELLSELHKQNVAALQEAQEAQHARHRDRARERRAAYGISDPIGKGLAPGPHDRLPDPTPPPPPAENFAERSIGKQMMKAMGYREGAGLGLNESGRTANIEVDVRDGADRRGIGVQPAYVRPDLKPGQSDSYKEKVWKQTYNRYLKDAE